MNLERFISQMITNYQPVAVDQHSFFINSIPKHLAADTDTETLSVVLSSVFFVAARCSRESVIHVDACVHDELVCVKITDNKTANNYAVLDDFRHLKLLAQRIGGRLEVHREKAGTAISFSFLNFTGKAMVKEMRRAS